MQSPGEDEVWGYEVAFASMIGRRIQRGHQYRSKSYGSYRSGSTQRSSEVTAHDRYVVVRLDRYKASGLDRYEPTGFDRYEATSFDRYEGTSLIYTK